MRDIAVMVRRVVLSCFFLGLSLGSSACGSSHDTPPVDAGLDAHVERDGSATDSGSLDAAPLDAGVDAGALDSGVEPDAGSPDVDAGPPWCDAACAAACASAAASGSSYGCDFVAIDLDNADLGAGRDAASQPLGIIVSNAGPDPAEIVIERNTAALGAPPAPIAVARATIAARAAQTFDLGSLEVDGSTPAGADDGTHTAISANAIHIRSTRPVALYQLNPIQSAAAFSTDGALVLPSHALGSRYTVVSWPQTLANTTDPATDMDVDLRAFLTIAPASSAPAHVTVTLGPYVVRVLGAGPVPESFAGSVVAVDLGPWDVLNLESSGFMADFSGTRVDATSPVAVFVGTEASDAPTFATLASRQCCADHLEEALAPDDRCGRRFVVARMPPRGAALNRAAGGSVVPELPDVDYVRVVAVAPGTTTVTTTLPAPRDRYVLAEREWIQIRADADFVLDADRPVSVVSVLPGQEASGIPAEYPGGDPSLFTVAAVEQFRSEVGFAIPEGFHFDAIVISAPMDAVVQLDGAALPADCTNDFVAPDMRILRCPMSHPILTVGPSPRLGDGVQRDGFHVVSADRPVGVVLYGFDWYVSYAFAAGATLAPPP